MGPPPRSFAADAHDCIMVRVLGPTEYKLEAVKVWPGNGGACRKGLVRRPTLTASVRASGKRGAGRRIAAIGWHRNPQQKRLPPMGYYPDLPCHLRLSLIALASPAMALQNRCLLSQIPVIVLGTMREAVETRFFCLEATSPPCTAW